MRLLITLDGSDLAERAIANMAPWIKRWPAETLLLTVLDPADSRGTPAGDERPASLRAGLDTVLAVRSLAGARPSALAEDRGQALEAARIEAGEAMEKVAGSYLPETPVSVHVEFSDAPAETIAEFARDQRVDFIAMSSHGRSGLGQALLGSVAMEVVRRAGVPVIMVGEEARAEVRGN